ncbi:pseudouridine synthase [Xanthomarina sp. F2636L]|uniref:pseudouridine synthase n=1 Tax=Xanthomarina sp. F2636L TaxID=2996018 RepID=UPI00225E6C67|nr:pseudouridine synthase [Xanthomarina sp. F2636L]MCX7549683.1 pseudouridine synthase [Xanthomarina sp. F2636L]
MGLSESHTHFKLYKPYGYLSQFVNNQSKRRNKKLLGTLFDFPETLMAIGRLDEKSEGLLLLTTDGKMSEHIRSSHVEKEYYVMVDGIITSEVIEILKKGVEISVDGKPYLAKPTKVFLFEINPDVPKRFVRDKKHGPTSWLSITLTEGKFRQVRKMTSAVGFPTLRLVRIRIGNFTLNQMQPGDVEEISTIL